MKDSTRKNGEPTVLRVQNSVGRVNWDLGMPEVQRPN